jgi:hypothetical protein
MFSLFHLPVSGSGGGEFQPDAVSVNETIKPSEFNSHRTVRDAFDFVKGANAFIVGETPALVRVHGLPAGGTLTRAGRDLSFGRPGLKALTNLQSTQTDCAFNPACASHLYDLPVPSSLRRSKATAAICFWERRETVPYFQSKPKLQTATTFCEYNALHPSPNAAKGSCSDCEGGGEEPFHRPDGSTHHPP